MRTITKTGLALLVALATTAPNAFAEPICPEVWVDGLGTTAVCVEVTTDPPHVYAQCTVIDKGECF